MSHELCVPAAVLLQKILLRPYMGTCLDVVAKEKNFPLC
jgi:hypothetical protein